MEDSVKQLLLVQGVFPIEHQRSMQKHSGVSKGATLLSDHSQFLSMPPQTARAIRSLFE